MKTQSVLFVLAFCAILVACNTIQKESVSDILEEDSALQEQKIRETLIDMWDAIEKGDSERYASHVHPDFTQFGETDSVLLVGKEAEVSGMKKFMEKAKDVHTEMIDPRITIRGNTAWIVYYWSDAGLINGEPYASRGKSTRIFIKEGGEWLCIHGHYTLMPEEVL